MASDDQAAEDLPEASRPQQQRPSSGEWKVGTAHPFVFVSAAADGDWVVLCQDREREPDAEYFIGYHGEVGLALKTWLLRHEKPDEVLDDFVAADPTGRFLVAIKAGKLSLYDTDLDETVDLTARGAVLGWDGDPYSSHPAASFGSLGERVLYLRERGGKTLAVVRTLRTGKETEVDPGPGLVVAAQLVADGKWVRFLVVAEDTDGDGTLRRPTVRTTLSGRRCRGPVMSSSSYGLAGDRPVDRFARVADRKVLDVENPVWPLGEDLLRRHWSGTIMLDTPGGEALEIVPASCGARILWADSATRRLVVDCRTRSGLEVFGPDGRSELKLGLGHLPDESVHNLLDGRDNVNWQPRMRLLWLRSGEGSTLVDLRDGEHRKMKGDIVWATNGSRALVTEGGTLWLLDVDNGRRERLVKALRGAGRGRPARAGPMYARQGCVVNLETGVLVGCHDGEALAVAADGRVLVTDNERKPSKLYEGPLHWRWPARAE